MRNAEAVGTSEDQSLRSIAQGSPQSGIDACAASVNGQYSSHGMNYENLKAELESTKRRLQKTEVDFERLQTEKLESIDRFQPEFDPTFISKVKSIEQKVNSLAGFLQKNFKISGGVDDEKHLASRMWSNRFKRGQMQIPPNDKDFLRKALKSLIWLFLQEEIFSSPFLCYGEQIGNQMTGIYSSLFKPPRRCSSFTDD
jgi:hypothetical protein